ncbi:hypothetical protein CYMTET_55779 [Cymbomonas tetramitiformis]|uniref:Uncharacterized protein n=1 Tax=Cymbomonas tetramitiformis TaxID=36881 RepID=A0AAE0BDN9_9CHLO|nr:hypothetical protein CYMTET_55779 [Cymbomonas tetramitiformis]
MFAKDVVAVLKLKSIVSVFQVSDLASQLAQRAYSKRIILVVLASLLRAELHAVFENREALIAWCPGTQIAGQKRVTMEETSLKNASEEEVCAFVQKLGMDPTPFRENEVNGALLVSLNDDELREDLELSIPDISKLRAALATPKTLVGAETLPTEALEQNSKPENEGDDSTIGSSDISSDDEQDQNEPSRGLEAGLQEDDTAVRRLRSLHNTMEADSLPIAEIEVIMVPSTSPKQSPQASTTPRVETPPEPWSSSGNPVYEDVPACAESSTHPTKPMSPVQPMQPLKNEQPEVQIAMESRPVDSPVQMQPAPMVQMQPEPMVQMQPAIMGQMQPATMVQMQPAIMVPMVPPTSQIMVPVFDNSNCRYDDRVDWPALQKKHASSSLQDGMDVENMGNLSDGQLAYDLQAGEQLHIALDILHVFIRRKLWMIILYTILTFGFYLVYLFCCCCCRPKRSERSKASLALTSGGRLVYWENSAAGLQQANTCCCIPGNKSIQSVTSMRYLPVNAVTKIEHLYLKDNGLLPCLNFINMGPFRTRYMITLKIHFTKLDASESSFVGKA